jgi:hypothetical protein
MRSANPHMISARGAPVLQSRAVHTPASTPAISGASAVLQGFRPASLPTATPRDRGRLSLIARISEEVLGVSGDPDLMKKAGEVDSALGKAYFTTARSLAWLETHTSPANDMRLPDEPARLE